MRCCSAGGNLAWRRVLCCAVPAQPRFPDKPSLAAALAAGEIVPQAACSRYGLEIGAASAPFVRLLMWLTAPVSYPIGWLLDLVLGHRHTALFRHGSPACCGRRL